MNPALPFGDLRPGDDAADIRAAIERVMDRGWYILGPELEAFEAEFARASGARFAVGVASGTDAIALLLRVAGVAPGDEVIVPALTAGFTALAVLSAGGTPVIADVDRDTLTLDAASCIAVMTPRVKAIVPVHLYGHPADLDPLRELASRHSIAIVEDCCQAHLATCRGRPVGTVGIGGAFSFYPTKNLGALGDAGAIVTNDARVAERVRRIRNGGQEPRHHHIEPGVNSRLDEIQAAVLRVRLGRLSGFTARRREIASLYRRGLAPVVTPVPERDPGHVYHLFPVRSGRRDQLMAHLRAAGVETLIHYPLSLPDQDAFRAYAPAPCPIAAAATAELLSLPMHPGLSDDQVNRVIDGVNRFTGDGTSPYTGRVGGD